jgi:hypothetical protein
MVAICRHRSDDHVDDELVEMGIAPAKGDLDGGLIA